MSISARSALLLIILSVSGCQLDVDDIQDWEEDKAWEELTAVLVDPDEDTRLREQAAMALKRIEIRPKEPLALAWYARYLGDWDLLSTTGDEATPALTDALYHFRDAKGPIRTLGLLKKAWAIDILGDILEGKAEGKWRLKAIPIDRWLAATALGSTGNERAVDYLLRELRVDEPRLRKTKMSRTGAPISNCSVDLRSDVASSLMLLNALPEDSEAVGWYAFSSSDVNLLTKQDGAALGAAKQALCWWGIEKRVQVFNWLGSLRVPAVTELLIRISKKRFLKDKDRMAVALALEKTGTAEAISLLGKMTYSTHCPVQKEAIVNLAKFSDPRAVKSLINAFRLDLSGCQRDTLIADALTKIGTLGVPVLIDALTDENVYNNNLVISVLGRIGDRTAAPSLISILKNWGHSKDQQSAAKALLAMGVIPDDQEGKVIYSLFNEDWQAIELDGDSAVVWIQGQVKTYNSGTRKLVVIALGKTRSRKAIATLVEFMNHKELEVKEAVGEALGNIVGYLGSDVVFPELIRHLGPETDKARWVASSATWAWMKPSNRLNRWIVQQICKKDFFAAQNYIAALQEGGLRGARSSGSGVLSGVPYYIRMLTDSKALEIGNSETGFIGTTPSLIARGSLLRNDGETLVPLYAALRSKEQAIVAKSAWVLRSMKIAPTDKEDLAWYYLLKKDWPKLVLMGQIAYEALAEAVQSADPEIRKLASEAFDQTKLTRSENTPSLGSK